MNTLHADYCAHCMRAKAEGFKQLPFGRFMDLYSEFMGDLI